MSKLELVIILETRQIKSPVQMLIITPHYPKLYYDLLVYRLGGNNGGSLCKLNNVIVQTKHNRLIYHVQK